MYLDTCPLRDGGSQEVGLKWRRPGDLAAPAQVDVSCSPGSAHILAWPLVSELLEPSWVAAPTLPLTSWVTSAKLLDVSEIQLLPL